MLVDIDAQDGDEAAERTEAAAQDVKERLHWSVDEFMARHDLLGISASRSDSVVVLVQPGKTDAKEIIRLAGELQAVIAEMLPEISVSIGIGRPHRQLIDLRQSYYEASYAIKIRKLKGEPRVIASFDDLGSYGLLLGLQDTLSLEVFLTTASSASSRSTTSRTRATWSRALPSSWRPTATGATPPRNCTCTATRCGTA